MSEGLDWVASHAVRPAVVLLSLGVADSQESQVLGTGVRQLIGKGLVVVIAAGNTRSDACTIAPACVGGTHGPAITVAGSNMLPHQVRHPPWALSQPDTCFLPSAWDCIHPSTRFHLNICY